MDVYIKPFVRGKRGKISKLGSELLKCSELDYYKFDHEITKLKGYLIRIKYGPNDEDYFYVHDNLKRFSHPYGGLTIQNVTKIKACVGAVVLY